MSKASLKEFQTIVEYGKKNQLSKQEYQKYLNEKLFGPKPRPTPWLPLSQTPSPKSPSEVVLNALLNYKQTLLRWLKPLSSCREPSSRKTR